MKECVNLEYSFYENLDEKCTFVYLNPKGKCDKYLAHKEAEYCLMYVSGGNFYTVIAWKRKRNYDKKLPNNSYYVWNKYTTMSYALIELNSIEKEKENE